jgi:hypothetical protein
MGAILLVETVEKVGATRGVPATGLLVRRPPGTLRDVRGPEKGLCVAFVPPSLSTWG